MELICPECRIKLSKSEDIYNCSSCNFSYPIFNGIPSFLKESDSFYEGKFVSTHKIYINWPFKAFISIYNGISISSSVKGFMKSAFRKILPDLNKSNDIHILDLGCGGGWEELMDFGIVFIPAIFNASSGDL